jgi:predicted metalloprotease with PDZ domain
VRENREDQYGFDFKTLRTEGRHVANNVRMGYPADKAGLRDGDYILEVNGDSTDGMEHDAVVNRISKHPNQVELLVVSDINGYLNSRRPSSQQRPESGMDTRPQEVNVKIPLTPTNILVEPDNSNLFC